MSTANVLRYSALGLGVLCGFNTDLSNYFAGQVQKEEDEHDRRVKLVQDAKVEYAKLHPVVKKPESVGEINLDDPNLDFGALIVNAVDSLKA